MTSYGDNCSNTSQPQSWPTTCHYPGRCNVVQTVSVEQSLCFRWMDITSIWLVPDLWRCSSYLKLVSLKLISRIYIFRISYFPVKLPSGESHNTPLMVAQHWFRWWLGAWWHQAITWANVEPVLCWCMVSLGHNELKDQSNCGYIGTIVMEFGTVVPYSVQESYSYTHYGTPCTGKCIYKDLSL